MICRKWGRTAHRNDGDPRLEKRRIRVIIGIAAGLMILAVIAAFSIGMSCRNTGTPEAAIMEGSAAADISEEEAPAEESTAGTAESETTLRDNAEDIGAAADETGGDAESMPYQQYIDALQAVIDRQVSPTGEAYLTWGFSGTIRYSTFYITDLDKDGADELIIQWADGEDNDTYDWGVFGYDGDSGTWTDETGPDWFESPWVYNSGDFILNCLEGEYYIYAYDAETDTYVRDAKYGIEEDGWETLGEWESAENWQNAHEEYVLAYYPLTEEGIEMAFGHRQASGTILPDEYDSGQWVFDAVLLPPGEAYDGQGAVSCASVNGQTILFSGSFKIYTYPWNYEDTPVGELAAGVWKIPYDDSTAFIDWQEIAVNMNIEEFTEACGWQSGVGLRITVEDGIITEASISS